MLWAANERQAALVAVHAGFKALEKTDPIA
jgi:hypothetical protein